MIKPRWQKVLADFWENKVRAMLVVASIFIGVFSIGMIIVADEILPSSLEQVYQSSNPAHIILQTEDFDHDLIDSIARIPGVAAVTGRHTVVVRARLQGEQEWDQLQLIAIEDPAEAEMKTLTLKAGTLAAGKGDILMLTNALADYPVSPGSVLEVELSDGTIRAMPVAGIVSDYSAGIEITLNRRMAYVDESSLEFLHAPATFNTLYVVTEGDPATIASIQAVAAAVEKRVEDSGRVVISEKLQTPQDHPYGNYISAISVILTFMGILVVVLGSFLIINTMNSLMAQQVRQIGVMKLIGAQTRDIVGMYLVLVSLFGFFAFVLGVPASSLAAYLLSDYSAQLLNGKIVGVSMVPITLKQIIIQAAVAFIIPIAASLMPILRGAKTTVVQALDNSLIKSERESTRFDRWIEHIRGVYGIMLLAIRNTFRRKGRLALTLFTLSLGGAIFIGVFNVQAMLDKHIDTIAHYSAADLFLTFNRSYLTHEIVPIAQAIPGVSTAEGWQVLTAQLELDQQVESVFIEAPPDGSALLNGTTHTGRWVTEDELNTIVVNEDFRRTFPDLQPGDVITLQVNGYDVELTVVGIFNYTGLQDKRGYINARTAADLLGNSTKTASYRLVTDDHSLESQIHMEETVNQVFRDAGYDVNRVSSLQVIINETGEKINIVINVLLVNAILTGLVGSIGLSGTLSLNVLERTSEIGILRAIGAHDRIVSRLVIYEGFFIGLVSYVVGFGFSFPISYVLGNLVNEAIFSADAQMTLNPVGFIVWFVLVIVMSIFASVLPARNATRLTIREVLAYE